MRLIPAGLEPRLRPLFDRWNRFLREFEWTWTKASLVGVGFWLFLIVSTSGIPSFWLYFADNRLGWGKSFWLAELRDFIAANLAVGPGATVVVIVYFMQKQRQKLRGAAGGTRPSGGYR